MNTECYPLDHELVPLVEQRDDLGQNEILHRRCRKCGLVTDERELALKVKQVQETEAALKLQGK